MHFKPWLPEEWQEIRFRLHWHGSAVDIGITHHTATFTLAADHEGPLTVWVRDEAAVLIPGETTLVALTAELEGTRNG
jgi:alpha,alpha-trehalose phosphorylase